MRRDGAAGRALTAAGSSISAVCGATATLAGLALPALCAGCADTGTPWCPRCAREFALASAYPHIVAGRSGTACSPDGFVVAAAAYSGVVRRAVSAYKDGDRRDLSSVLVAPMRAALVTTLTLLPPREEPLAVVPAPSSARSRRRRGDVPTHLLIRSALAGGGVLTDPCLWAPVLRHRRGVADQAHLSRVDRARNTDHAFQVVGDVEVWRGREVIVADDVVTTGATARECVRALRAVGARPVAVVALAATPGRGR